MEFIKGTQVVITHGMDRDTIRDIVHKRINWNYPYGVWCTVSDVCEALGIEPTHNNCVHVGMAIREKIPAASTRRSNGRKLILVPCQIIDAAD